MEVGEENTWFTECLHIDLDGDGDPDILRTVTANGIPVQ